MRRPQRLLAALLVATGVASAVDARACINATLQGGPPTPIIPFLRRAEHDFEAGYYAEGRSEAVAALEIATEPWERERANWFIAMSNVRDELASRNNLQRAVETMRRIKENRTLTDVVSALDLAEALSRLPEGRAEALQLLVPLAREDLVGSAHAYAALMRIADDEAMRRLAQTRCQHIAGESELCTRTFVESPSTHERLLVAILVAVSAILLATGVTIVVRSRQREKRMASVATDDRSRSHVSHPYRSLS